MGYIFDAMNRAGRNHPQTPAPASVGKDAGPEPVIGPIPLPTNPVTGTVAAPAATLSLSPAESGSVIGPAIAVDNVIADDRLVIAREPSGIIAEEYRAIRTSLLARWQNRRHLIHTITSATPQEGKTITSLNLGLCFAELHTRKVLVIEADLRLPQFKNLLGLPEGPGMVDVLEGKAELSQVIQAIGETQLHVIAAGREVHNEAAQLLSMNTMVEVLKTLRTRYDHIIIDTPPVVELADAGILGALSDDVLLVARMSRTPRSLIEMAMRTLASYNAPVAGMIATDQHHHQRRYYYKKYGYYYHYYHRYHRKAA